MSGAGGIGGVRDAGSTGPAAVEPVLGRYWHLSIQGRRYRVYVEEAGRGTPLVCLHTAGSDSRQYRHLLNDADVTRRFRVVAFDLPWHGRSSPPAGWPEDEYLLTPGFYLDAVMAVVDGLALERPVVMGCSVGGRAVLHLLITHGARFRAGIALQASRSITGVLSRWQRELRYLDRPDVHAGEAAAALVAGIMAPQSPAAERWETLWHYTQAGPGVMHGDTHYYKDSGLLAPEELARIDTARTPLVLLSGEYDWGATPAHAEEVARCVPGARLTIMPGLGHFPMSEHYAAFREHLLPVLDSLASNDTPTGDNR